MVLILLYENNTNSTLSQEMPNIFYRRQYSLFQLLSVAKYARARITTITRAYTRMYLYTQVLYEFYVPEFP